MIRNRGSNIILLENWKITRSKEYQVLPQSKSNGKQSGRTTQTVKSIKMRVKQLSALKTNLYDDIKDARPRRDDVFQVTAPPLTAPLLLSYIEASNYSDEDNDDDGG